MSGAITTAPPPPPPLLFSVHPSALPGSRPSRPPLFIPPPPHCSNIPIPSLRRQTTGAARRRAVVEPRLTASMVREICTSNRGCCRSTNRNMVFSVAIRCGEPRPRCLVSASSWYRSTTDVSTSSLSAPDKQMFRCWDRRKRITTNEEALSVP